MKVVLFSVNAVLAAGRGVAASSDICLLRLGGICGHGQFVLFDVALCAAYGRPVVQSSDQHRTGFRRM